MNSNPQRLLRLMQAYRKLQGRTSPFAAEADLHRAPVDAKPDDATTAAFSRPANFSERPHLTRDHRPSQRPDLG